MTMNFKCKDLPDFDPHYDHPLWDFANKPTTPSVSYMCLEWLYASADYLVKFSPRHLHYSPEDMCRTIYSAIYCEQALFMFARNPNTDKNQPRAFMTWAWLSPEAEDEYLNQGRKLQPYDFPRTSLEDTLWVIDLVAPFGAFDVRWLCRRGQEYLSPVCYKNGLKGVKVLRGYKRQGFFYAKGGS